VFLEVNFHPLHGRVDGPDPDFTLCAAGHDAAVLQAHDGGDAVVVRVVDLVEQFA